SAGPAEARRRPQPRPPDRDPDPVRLRGGRGGSQGLGRARNDGGGARRGDRPYRRTSFRGCTDVPQLFRRARRGARGQGDGDDVGRRRPVREDRLLQTMRGRDRRGHVGGGPTRRTTPSSRIGNQSEPSSNTRTWFALISPWSETAAVATTSCVDGSMPASSGPSSVATHRAVPSNASPSGATGVSTVETTSLVAGSIACTWSTSVHDTHRRPPASAMICGPCSVVISATTFPFAGSIRVIVPSK